MRDKPGPATKLQWAALIVLVLAIETLLVVLLTQQQTYRADAESARESNASASSLDELLGALDAAFEGAGDWESLLADEINPNDGGQPATPARAPTECQGRQGRRRPLAALPAQGQVRRRGRANVAQGVPGALEPEGLAARHPPPGLGAAHEPVTREEIIAEGPGLWPRKNLI